MRSTFGPAVATAAVLLASGCTTDDDGSTGTTPTSTGATQTATSEAPTTAAPTDDETSEATTETTGDDSTTEATSEDETSDAPSTGDATETGIPPSTLPDWTSDPVQEEPQQGESGQEITGVRTGLHESYDRVVLDLTGDEPSLGWLARLVDETFEDGSGRPVEVEGERFLELGVNGIDWTTESPDRYDGDPVQGQGTEVVTEVVFGVLFEGQQQIFIGLREDTEYRIFSLSDPARIVIDVRHP